MKPAAIKPACRNDISRLPVSGSADRVLECPDRSDGDADPAAGSQETGRIEADPDAFRRARGKHIAGLWGHACRDGLDQGWNVEDEILDRRILTNLAINLRYEPQPAGITDRIGSHDRWPHRRKAVEALSEKPLPVSFCSSREVTSFRMV